MSGISYGPDEARPGEWPKGETPGQSCPHRHAGDMVKLSDTKGCTIHSQWHGMCPCAAVLGGWDDAWCGYDDEGNELPCP